MGSLLASALILSTMPCNPAIHLPVQNSIPFPFVNLPPTGLSSCFDLHMYLAGVGYLISGCRFLNSATFRSFQPFVRALCNFQQFLIVLYCLLQKVRVIGFFDIDGGFIEGWGCFYFFALGFHSDAFNDRRLIIGYFYTNDVCPFSKAATIDKVTSPLGNPTPMFR